LAPHSKGDDDRDPAEIEAYRRRDTLAALLEEAGESAIQMRADVDQLVGRAVDEALAEPELSLDQYVSAASPKIPLAWLEVERIDRRQVDLVNEFFHDAMEADPSIVFLGEDVLSPYGGAFKIARGLSDRFPDRVLTTPISEAGIVGVGNGLALSGFRPYVEIMFGDFVTLCFDQIVNHASKFRRMYNGKVRCPLVVRTPMGGRRGYGPTHSQTLDKFLCGIDDVRVVALNALLDPRLVYRSIHDTCEDPTIVIENKLDYGRKLAYAPPAGYRVERTDAAFPTVRVSPKASKASLTLVAYGGAAMVALESIAAIFDECEQLVEVVVPTSICPIDLDPILDSVSRTRAAIVVEEGSAFGGFGAELLATLAERVGGLAATRVSALPVPIPSAKLLESKVLPQVADVVEAALRLRR
jgi:2-oxoisovalerate dehydrogenase E1 component